MKKIKLTQDQWVLVDDEDYERLNEHKWYASSHRSGNFYVQRGVSGTTSAMHREIMKANKGEQIDHINGNTLDNRKENLRLCSNQQNGMNRSKQRNNASGYKGVCYRKKHKDMINELSKPWVAQICRKTIGVYKTKEEAARAYDQKAIELFGEFAQLNFPEEWMNVHGVIRYDRKRDKRE